MVNQHLNDVGLSKSPSHLVKRPTASFDSADLFNEKFQWTDGYGNYRNSNDVSYDPNQHENGNWQLMPLSR
jgi:hypothetical protein